MKSILLKYYPIILVACFNSLNGYCQEKERITVYTIMNTECPISQNVVPILNDLKKRYSPIHFIHVFSKWDSRRQIENFKKKYQLQGEVYHDKKHRLITRLKAAKTPETFFVSSISDVLYKGAINDQYLAVGIRKQTAITCFLEDAIKDYLSTGVIKNAETKAVGCKIEPLKKL